MEKVKSHKMYNVLFPVWALILFPIMWLVIIPGNFIIDSLVLIFSLMILKVAQKKLFYKKYIFKIFLFGMLSDIIGTFIMFILQFVFELGIMGDELYITLPGLLFSAGLIFIFNYFITFKKLDKKLRFKLALIFAIATAPYTFLIPTSWLY